MRIMVEGSTACLTVECVPDSNNSGDNGDSYDFRISAEGQPIQVGGKDVPEVRFTVVGGWELSDLFEGMATVRKAL